MEPGIAGGAAATNPAAGKQFDDAIIVRPATLDDAQDVAQILAEAFPSLYRSTFGKLKEARMVRLLTALYRAGTLSLEATRVAERSGGVIGLVVLHVGKSIGRGSAAHYWRVLRRELPWWRLPHAFFGGISVNAMLSKRIPAGPELVYIEALAVAAADRGAGIGTKLLEDAADWASRSRRRQLALHVLEANYGARRLYERTGFRQWHPRGQTRRSILVPFSTRPPGWSAILMLRKLHPSPR